MWRFILPVSWFLFQLLGGAELVWGMFGGREKMLELIPVFLSAFRVPLGISLSVLAMMGLWFTGKSWDRRKANRIVAELERFEVEGRKQYHPILRTFDFTAKRENTLRRIAEKHHKWLDAKDSNGSITLSWKTVQNANDSIDILRLYGFIWAKWKKWRNYCKK